MAQSNPARRIVLVAAAVAQRAHYRGIARYAREHNWHLVSDMIFTGAFPVGWTGDGILAVVGHQPELMNQVRETGLPCVAVAHGDRPLHLPAVEEDHRQIGRVAADHLLERAYRSFAWAPLIDDRPNRERFEGFRSRLAEHGCDCQMLAEAHRRIGEHWQCDWADYRHRLIGQLKECPRPTAIFAFNDSVAANLIDACRDCGISVPEEFAILGVGNDPLVCESVPVPLSSVEPDYEEIAYRAAAVLDRLMTGDAAPVETLRIPAKGVVTRVSTDVTAVADRRIARALAFIAERYSDPMLSVLDVASAVGVSRRNLERNFRQVTGLSVREYIVRIRMHEASRLLRRYPRTKTDEIASLVGIAGLGNFFRTFRRYYGMSPKAHREWAGREPGAIAPARFAATPDIPPAPALASA